MIIQYHTISLDVAGNGLLAVVVISTVIAAIMAFLIKGYRERRRAIKLRNQGFVSEMKKSFNLESEN